MYAVSDELRNAWNAGKLYGLNPPNARVIILDKAANNILPISSCTVKKSEAYFSNYCSFGLVNRNPSDRFDIGYYSPDRGDDYTDQMNDWYQVLMPGTKVRVEMGYGDEFSPVFTGCISDIVIDTKNGNYSLACNCNDYGYKLKNTYINEYSSIQYLSYDNMDVADILTDLCSKAGIPAENLSFLSTSGIKVTIDFENITIDAAIVQLMDTALMNFWFDEMGNAKFEYLSDAHPKQTGEEHVLSGTDEVQLNCYPISAGSERVISGVNTYTADVDYTIDYGNGKIKRKSGSSIPDGATISVDYIYAGLVVAENVNLRELQYFINSRDQYGKIILQGGAGEAIYTMPDPVSRGITANKIKIEQNDLLDTMDKVNEVLARMSRDMLCRFREASFKIDAFPQLQIGDCVQIKESSSTATEIYRVNNMTVTLTSQAFYMECSAFHFGYTELNNA